MALTAIIVAFISGIIISSTYIKTHERKHSQNFALTVVLLPAIIAIIIMLIGSDIAKAFSLAGAFSIIRFRSAPGDPKDIAFVLFAMAAGLAAGVSLYAFSILFAVILCGVMVLMNKVNFGQNNLKQKRLKITVPEDLDYQEVFVDVFERFTTDIKLTNVKTTAMGSLYQLSYDIVLKEEDNVKAFIDDLRIRNGNLNISLNLIDDVTYG
jgi:hypothetical protein